MYLPQFHPVAENDAWWGKGFTEWTNTAKARALFRGHYQPHVPADLGFYDLRMNETRAAQASLARQYGIEAFCYYHYWFAGRRILERPFQEVIESREPDFPFCLCWANDTWTGVWYGEPNRVLIEQTYPGRADHEAHFETLLPAFSDPRYVRVDGKPVFVVFKPEFIPTPLETLDHWREMAVKAGLGGIYFIGISARPAWQPSADGFDGKIDRPLVMNRSWVSRRQPLKWTLNQIEIKRGLPSIQSYAALLEKQPPVLTAGDASYPCVIHAWDNTPRSGRNGVVLSGSTPELYRQFLDRAVALLQGRQQDRRLLFLLAWNEWAEGNHLEPDLKYGHAYLRQVAAALGVAVPVDVT